MVLLDMSGNEDTLI
jgi:hypothetical protein